MTNWKILITDGLSDSGKQLLESAAQVDDRAEITADELLAIAGQYDALIVRGRTKVTRPVFEAAQTLKVVGRAGVGVDNIDLQAAREHQVTVVNAPTSTSIAVAELTLALMLAVTRMVPRADAAMKNGQWLKKELEGVELFGKTAGILGMGNIGAEVARRAAAFGMHVIGYDPLLPADVVRTRGADPVALEALYQQSDLISLHVPLTDETRSMVGREAFSHMKPGAYLVCAARGGVIDEEALLEALQSGKIAGAALDVFAKEPPGSTALVEHPRLVATPHIGAQTAEAQTRASEDIAAEVLAALRSETLRWKVA